MQFDRRSFIKAALAGTTLSALGPVLGSPFMNRALASGLGASTKKMLVIFMRGGNDGVNTCIPYGDSEYNLINRPNIFIPEAQSLDLGNGFAALHPALGPLHELHLAGDLATVHRVAYANQSRSHFDSQNIWENAIPGEADLSEGWAYRHVIDAYDLAANPVAAASISDRLMLMFKGGTALPHISNLAEYNLDVPGSSQDKVLGSAPDGGSGSGLLGWYGKSLGSGHGHDSLVSSTGLTIGETLSTLEDAGIDPATYLPAGGATYPDESNPLGFPATAFPFFRQLRDAAMLLKQSDLRIAGVEVGSFDTHSNQGGVGGAQAGLLAWIAHGIRSLSQDLASQWDDTLVLTLSEFGRTSEQNGSLGTDHGEASCLFVAGGQVNGGVYNCDASTWSDGDMFSTGNGRYVAHLTDFRTILREIFDRHFGVDATGIESVIPGIGAQAGNPLFNDIGFLP